MNRKDGMEHRWGGRKPMVVPVTVYHQGAPVGRGRTRNIGREGIFIEADALRFPVHTVLELELPQALTGRRGRQRIPGLVIHNHNDGVGVMFCSFDHHLFKGIDELLDRLSSAPADEQERRLVGTA